MNKLYVKGNYIIAEIGGNVYEYSKSHTVYNLEKSIYRLINSIGNGSLLIPIADIGTWFDEAGTTAFTEATLVTFLRANSSLNTVTPGEGSPSGNVQSTKNSTVDLLGVSETFTGEWETVTDYTSIAVSTLGSIATDGVLWFDVRKIGSTIVNSVPFFRTDITSNPTNIPAIWNIVEGEFRIRYVNGLTAQTGEWFLDTKLSNGQNSELLTTASGTINSNTPVTVGKTITTSKQPSGLYKDNPHNGVAISTNALLGIGGVYMSDWIDTDGYNMIELFIASDVVSANLGVVFEFTDDLTGTPTAYSPEAFTFGVDELARGDMNVFLLPKMVGFRYTYTNGGTGQGLFLSQIDLKTNGKLVSRLDSTILGSEDATLNRSVIAGNVLDGNLIETGAFDLVSILQNKALKVAIPPSVLYQKSRPTDDAIPTGALPVIDLVLNTEPNVLDSGWMPTASYGGGSLVNIITDANLVVYIMNSSDSIGSNIIGNLAPTILPLADTSATIGAAFFDKYFRIVIVNNSGIPADSYSMIVYGLQTPAASVFTSLDQQIFGFYPAPIVRSVGAGQDDDGIYHNIRSTRAGDIASAISDADLGFHAIVTPGGGLKIAEQTHLVGEPFGGAALNTTKWSIDLVGSGTQDASGDGEMTMDTGVVADSVVEINSMDVARFIPANYNTTHHAITIPDGASYAADNNRKWGAFDATNAVTANGVYFELDNGNWYVTHCLNGVSIRTILANWNGAGVATFPLNSVNANVYEIEYNAGSIIYRVNGNVMHRETLLSTPYADDIHFPVGMSSTNYNGSTTDVSMKVRAAAIYTLGKGQGADRPFFIPGTNGGVIVKTGPGHLGKVIFSRTGNTGGDATVLVYDALSATNQIGRLSIGSDNVVPVEYDLTFNIGLFIVVSGTGTLGTTITFD